MLKYEQISKRSTLYELQVKSILSQLPTYFESIELAASSFEQDLKKIPRASTATADLLYKVAIAEDRKSFEVYHVNVKGDKDRTVAIISKV